MADRTRSSARAEILALQDEVARLNRVVEALMDRAEASLNVQDSDFGLFQTTIMLQDHVRLHTEALESALDDAGGAATDPSASVLDMQTLRRTAALQIQLLELVVQQKDVGDLVDRVASILDLPIVLFDTRGRVVCLSQSAARLPGIGDHLWTARKALRGAPQGEAVAVSPSERVLYRDVLVMGRVERVLAAVAGAQGTTKFADASLRLLQQLVTLDLLRGRDELRMRRRLRRGLLHDILAGDGRLDDLKVRLQAQGFDDESVLRIVVVEPGNAERRRDDARPSAKERRGAGLLRALDTALSERRVPYLTSYQGPWAVILTELPDKSRAAALTLLESLQTAAAQALAPVEPVVGCSAPLIGIAGAVRGLQQAKAACIAARRTSRPDAGAGLFDDLSGQLRLLDGLDAEALGDIVQRTFAPLLDYDAHHRTALCQTLRTLFEHGLAVQETADALHIHRNTLQKRLTHAERLLAIDLNDLDAVVDVRLGLHAAELLGRPLG